MVQIGTTQGLRYLHCNLCETEWHVVRVKCSNCEQSGPDYWSLDDEQAAIKAESCDDSVARPVKFSIRKKIQKSKP